MNNSAHPSKSHKSKIEARKEVYAALSDFAHAMAAPARLRIIQILSNRSSSVEELSERIGESIANTSQHLQKLKKAGMVSDSREGVKRTYSLANPAIIDAFLQIQSMATQMMPTVRALEDEFCPKDLRSDQPLEEILESIRSKKAVLIDVRDRDEFESTPASQAIFFPRGQVEKNLNFLNKKKPVYAFCRGRFCFLANDIVRKLRKKGYRAYRLKEMSREIDQAMRKQEQ